MADDIINASRTRRSFLDLLLGTAAVTWLASMLYPVVRYLKPLPSAGPSGPSKLTSDEIAALERNHFVIVPVSGSRVLVFQDSAFKLRALDAKCTHEGCTVQFVPGESVIWCACHNARFDLDGRVLSGPPPRPLPRYDAHRDEDGDIVIYEQEA
jgi:cytochrome b6-f complex iron-sulfur subunit